MLINSQILVSRLTHEQDRLATAKAKVDSCNHPDDLVMFAAAFKAQAARVNLLEDILYSLYHEGERKTHMKAKDLHSGINFRTERFGIAMVQTIFHPKRAPGQVEVYALTLDGYKYFHFPLDKEIEVVR